MANEGFERKLPFRFMRFGVPRQCWITLEDDNPCNDHMLDNIATHNGKFAAFGGIKIPVSWGRKIKASMTLQGLGDNESVTINSKEFVKQDNREVLEVNQKTFCTLL